MNEFINIGEIAIFAFPPKLSISALNGYFCPFAIGTTATIVAAVYAKHFA